MSMRELRRRIEGKEARLGVIGLGYVGLPVAVLFAKAGFDVLGVDIRPERVAQINAGFCPIEGEEPGLAERLVEVVRTGQLRATTDYGNLRDRDVVLICVETPVDEERKPRYKALRSALHSLGPVLKEGALVIVESTLAPRTMQDLVLPLLEEASGRRCNEGFYLGHCPERVRPGRLLRNLQEMSRVVGGMTPETAETMAALYRHIVRADLDLTDCLTAELVKTVENAYRDVQIAFANEVALICEAVGGDVWRVRKLVNKVPERQMHLPGSGVGGHCIPKDPWLLAYAAQGKMPLRVIPAARAVNDVMPLHVAELLEDALAEAGLSLAGARVAVLGYAYLEESDDTRNSPSETLVSHLRASGARVVIHDPWVKEYQGDLWERIQGCDAAVVMVAHRAYRELNLDRLGAVLARKVLVDGRGLFADRLFPSDGWIYRCVGKPRSG
ncbi:MAG: nucleotide sugar dehydrogenase [Anaerolineae bacterium]|nr:nucleotide sugar dehydrogenase [Anaerolineae bacterium]